MTSPIAFLQNDWPAIYDAADKAENAVHPGTRAAFNLFGSAPRTARCVPIPPQDGIRVRNTYYLPTVGIGVVSQPILQVTLCSAEKSYSQRARPFARAQGDSLVVEQS